MNRQYTYFDAVVTRWEGESEKRMKICGYPDISIDHQVLSILPFKKIYLTHNCQFYLKIPVMNLFKKSVFKLEA